MSRTSNDWVALVTDDRARQYRAPCGPLQGRSRLARGAGHGRRPRKPASPGRQSGAAVL